MKSGSIALLSYYPSPKNMQDYTLDIVYRLFAMYSFGGFSHHVVFLKSLHDLLYISTGINIET